MGTLSSPGVDVSVINESFYRAGGPSTVPLIFVATAQNKKNGSGTGTAQGTIAANVGKMYSVTSQRDLIDLFGTPLFYTDANKNPLHGDELNEYGLQAAYSLLGVTSRAYIVRADVNLDQLIPSTSAPVGDPVNNTQWLDTGTSNFVIYEWVKGTSGGTPLPGYFVSKKPRVIDDSTKATYLDLSSLPLKTFGKIGEYCLVITSDRTNALYYKNSTNNWEVVRSGFDGGKTVLIDSYVKNPKVAWDQNLTITSGSVWINTTKKGQGQDWVIKRYNSNSKIWTTVATSIYSSTFAALGGFDAVGGGQYIPTGTTFIEAGVNGTPTEATFAVWKRRTTGETVVTGLSSTTPAAAQTTFGVTVTDRFGVVSSVAYITVPASGTDPIGSVFPDAVAVANIPNFRADWNPVTNQVSLVHELGGDFQLVELAAGDGGGSLAAAGIVDGVQNLYQTTRAIPGVNVYQSIFHVSHWEPMQYNALSKVPSSAPTNGKIWYNTNLEVDILVHDGVTWVGYKNAFPLSDPAGPLISASMPVYQRDGVTPIQHGDVWIETSSSMEEYGRLIHVFDSVLNTWVRQDLADQSTPDGWLFADARWSTSGADTVPASIRAMVTSDYLDPDAPDPAQYPSGMRLWNLRRSGFNVKQYVTNYINLQANGGKNPRYVDPATSDNEMMTGYSADRWVTVSPNNEDGSGRFGRHAQRGFVVAKLKALIDTNDAVRNTDTALFNLIATPGYPEAYQNMVALNIDRKITSFVVGDTPMRLASNATDLLNWGSNANGAYDNGDQGAVTFDEYSGLFYPSGYTSDNSGNYIVVPPSHMILRTIINSDNKSYPWMAPAGTRRGLIDNASSVGFLNKEGEFQVAVIHEGLRGILGQVKINPIATFDTSGLVNYGQYTRASEASALDRINVARLTIYIRRQLGLIAKPFLFEPNDTQTRREFKQAVDNFFLELVGLRAVYDFISVCDESNNFSSRIDRNEMYMDVAYEPVKSTEFIYVPMRIKNTGEIANGG